MSEPAVIEGIRRAAKRRERAERDRRKAMDDLRQRAQEAQAQGVGVSQIAREAGLSRQGVYDLLGSRPPS